MIENFQVLHKKTPSNDGFNAVIDGFAMGTCVRSIVFRYAQGSQPSNIRALDYSFFEGHDAYEFVLKIICGLESPMIGETEIFGQFKEFLKNNRNDMPAALVSIMDNLARDAKRVRYEHLQNLGCTSYGSLLRKQLKDDEFSLVVAGSGSLAQDIFPWFSKSAAKISAFTRSPEKHQDLADSQANLSIENYRPLEKPKQPSILIIAAPLASDQIHKFFNLNHFEKVYDLRSDSDSDHLGVEHTVTLKALFEDLELHRKQAAKIKERAEKAVALKAHSIAMTEKPRPFGWDDLWNYA